MISLGIDEQKLRVSLEKAAKRFGDSTKQATARLAVQTAREMAVSSQVYGKSGTKKKQDSAIEAGMRAVIVELEAVKINARTVSGLWTSQGKRVTWPLNRYLKTPDEVNRWVDKQRGRKGHTPKGTTTENLAATSKTIFRKALRMRKLKSGMAKGGQLGAAMAAVGFQKGGQRITIGKNFLGYAQKHMRKGRARQGGAQFNPNVTLTSSVAHGGSSYVLRQSEIRKNIGFAARKTLQWYRKAAREALK